MQIKEGSSWIGCTPRIGGNRGEFTTRETGVPYTGRRGAREASLQTSGTGGRMEARQKAMRIFSGTPLSSTAPRSLPSGFT
jgi:hypothetical protein